jgi:hypothetical protein
VQLVAMSASIHDESALVNEQEQTEFKDHMGVAGGQIALLNKEIEQMEFKEFREMMQSWRTFGCFTIFLLHPMGFVKILPLLVIIAQWMIPIGLLLDLLHGNSGEAMWNEQSWCSGTGTIRSKLLMCAVGLVYVSRMGIYYGGLLAEMFPSLQDSISHGSGFEDIQRRRAFGINRSILNVYGRVDDWMALTHESLLMILNLILVFLNDDPVEIVFNSLAMEFVIQLGVEFKELYIKYNAAAIKKVYDDRYYYFKYCGLGYDDLGWMFVFPGVLRLSNRIMLVVLPLVCLCSVLVAPFCKQ